jgi:hypothetical protein
MDETDVLYLDKNENGRYKYHMNGINIEKVINSTLNNVINITINKIEGKQEDGQEIYKN